MVAASAWVGALVGHSSAWAWGGVGALGLIAVGRRLGRAVVLASVATAATGVWLGAAVSAGPAPLQELAAVQAQVSVVVEIGAQPHPVTGRFDTTWVMPVTFREVTGRGQAFVLRAPGVLSGDERWRQIAAGSLVQTSGRLLPGRDGVLLSASGEPTVREGPGAWRRGAEAVRASIRSSVAGAPEEPRALLPALVDGERSGLPPQVVADFQVSGLTHLAAVSGANVGCRGVCGRRQTLSAEGRATAK